MTDPKNAGTYQPGWFKTDGGNTLVKKQGALFKTQDGIGAVPAGDTKTTVTELVGTMHHTKLVLAAQVEATVDHTTSNAQGSLELYDFPAGEILILGAECNLTITASGTPGLATNAAVVASIGTVAAASPAATLTDTAANILASIAATLTAYVGTVVGRTSGPATFDGITSALKAFLNLACPDAGSAGNDTVTVSGTINIIWINLGNN